MLLVDRGPDLTRVRDAVAAARSGRGGAVVAVSGEPGAGKSALLHEALAGEAAHWGWCEPGLTPRPLGPFRDLLRSLGTDPDTEDPGELLLAAMADRPLVLAVEDAHWIDDASARVLRFLGRRIASTRGVLVVSARDTIGPEHPWRQVVADLATAPVLERIHVGPLSVEGVAAVLAGTDRDPVEAHRVTGGNAFLVSALRDSPDDDLGATARDLAWSWARRLDGPSLALLTSIAVVPGRIPLADVRDAGEALDALVRSGLVHTDEHALEFRHELVRRALVAELSPDERLAAHAAAYERLRGRADAEPSALAFHALRAGLVDAALPHELAAAERAVAAGAHSQAVDHYRRVVDLAPGRLDDDELARACIALSGEEYTVGHDLDARRYAARAVGMTRNGSDRTLYAQALVARSRCAANEADCVGFAERAAVELEALGPSPELAAACAQAASRRMVSRHLDRAADWARRALEMVDEDEHPDIATVALQSLGSALTLQGEDDACTHLARAVALSTRHGLDEERGLTYANYVSAAGEVRLYDVVRSVEQEAVDFYAGRDLDGLAGYTYAWLARCAFEQGDWARAADLVVRRLDERARTSNISVIVALTVQARLLVRQGSPGYGVPLAEARDRAVGTGALQRLGPVAATAAEAAWLAGEEPDLDDLRAVRDLAVERGGAALAAELSFWLHRHGEPVDAAALQHPWDLWAAGAHEAAGDAWQEIGCPYEAADAWSGSDDEELLRRALVVADRLGAQPLRARITARMRDLGVRSIPRGPRRESAAHAHGLTGREQEVLTWVRRGSTDAEIAAALFLSTKTVSHHVSAILRKTGSASRRDLWSAPEG